MIKRIKARDVISANLISELPSHVVYEFKFFIILHKMYIYIYTHKYRLCNIKEHNYVCAVHKFT